MFFRRPHLRARSVGTLHLLFRCLAVPTDWRLVHASGTAQDRRTVHMVRLRPGGRRLVVKSFAEGAQAAQAFRAQAAVARRYPNTIAPLCHSRTGRYVVMPKASGRTATEALGTSSFDAVFEGPVRWLGALHGRPADGLPTVTLASRFDALLRRPRIAARPALAAAATAWRDAVAPLETSRPCPLHGDFHPGNIMSDAGAFWILDFAEEAAGPAVLDLAQLMAHLQLHLVLEDPGTAPRIWAVRRDRILGWYGRPDLATSPELAAALQLRRLHMLIFTFTQPPGPARERRMAFLWSQAIRTAARPAEALEL